MSVASDTFWDDLNPLLDAGIRVIPVNPGAKDPMWKNWQFGRQTPRKDGSLPPYGSSSATSDRERLVRLTERSRRPNIGVPTGQPFEGRFITALDVDVRHSGDESFADLCSILGRPPDTAMVETGSRDGSFHLWIWSAVPWKHTPKELGPGLEFKRAGQFVMAPPSQGYSWVTTPWGEGPGNCISGWDALDAYLGSLAVPLPAEAPKHRIIVPRVESWGSLDDCLRAIASAGPGERTATLLRHGGKIAYATATGNGLPGPSAVFDALWEACESNGLAEDYPQAELSRKIGVYVKWSDPFQNPLLLCGEETGRASSVIARLLPDLTKGRRAVFESLGTMARYQHHAYAERYGEIKTGIHRSTVRDALTWLRAKGLIEQGPSLWNQAPPGEKTRATHTYRLTALGNLMFKKLGERA